jgi:hypothetical protein
VEIDGLTHDGMSLWISDAQLLTVYQVTPDGTVLRSFLSPGQFPRGLAWDGPFLWNADGTQKIYQLRLST